ncbi:MAG TPA: histidine kinase N-terminal 7TM domain-containing protein [Cyclobacteriaceae bacterium]|nr:histidine kinase N-terminal 7TM domain-containing protein [Cyclobacteriaceae bacterium]
MDFQFNSYSTVLMMSGVAAFMVALILFQRQRSAIFWFALMMSASAIWAIAYSFELASDTLAQMLLFINIEYVGIGLLPALWIMFVIHFIEKRAWLTPITLCLIFIFPVVTMLMVWTNENHHLHYISASLDESGPFPLLAIQPGVWYRVHTIYFYVLLAFGVLLLGRYLRQSSDIYRKQTLIVLAGALIPWGTNFVYLLGLRPHQHIDLTPYAFILTSIIIAFGLLRYRLFDIVPFAREKLIEKLHEGMVVLDEQGRIIDLNAPVEKFLSRYTTKLIGKKLSEVVADQPAIQHLLLKKWQGREELVLTTENGERVYEISGTPLYSDEKRFVGTLLIMWDITSRKRTTSQLQELNQIRNRMFSIIAHDLKGPMNGLLGILQLAQSGVVSEAEIKGILPLLLKNVDNTKALLDNLLHWSKSQLEGEKITPEMIDLKMLTGNNITLFEKRMSEKGIELIDNIPQTTMVYADRDMLDLVLRNLIGNAIKFCDVDDTITITARPERDMIYVEVMDTGRGMSETMMKDVFGLSVTSTSGTRNEKGTGLGLKLCKDFVEKNGGEIGVKSVAGKGSTFWFTVKKSG